MGEHKLGHKNPQDTTQQIGTENENGDTSATDSRISVCICICICKRRA